MSIYIYTYVGKKGGVVRQMFFLMYISWMVKYFKYFVYFIILKIIKKFEFVLIYLLTSYAYHMQLIKYLYICQKNCTPGTIYSLYDVRFSSKLLRVVDTIYLPSLVFSIIWVKYIFNTLV